MTPDIDILTAMIRDRQIGDRRLLVAIAGAPASGKSTLSERLHHHLGGDEAGAVVVPMDGYHFDDAILYARGLLPRKGAPETFDTGGFKRTLEAIRTDDDDVYVPVFDRHLELSRGSARCVSRSHRIVLVEGNYLLLNQSPWNQLASLFDLTLFIDTPLAVLEKRLFQRWLDHGHDQPSARQKALDNDIPNARTVAEYSKSGTAIIINNA
ncbi:MULTISPECIES: nucleoside triphosphate hydrolase [Thalassospira]|jgi:pantothenate kinase|uniref:nucleoside triphosphate hydrolase n=1 Tax=Thalassospira TaxID=168934 RepID=UPI00080F85F6|nr:MULTISPECIES: nucleoside triphosphate hydrolase [Thalassospira]MAB31467.1 nucleoside triphosphate hydrolase [Thalassospira sp.]MBA05599.1 nucleoside triphosphate hydrolase [Thalassospira sp.]MDM7974547.1 nucleoside triphosphate hydrolase [Thalassospira xiamenensis]OCK06129.1 frcK, putative fructose transport system kinase [Thalassospira sp. KO164]OHZ02106.1 nucleoside/nucleotide kinase family protein [Thalassospira sp. MIT1004]